MVTLGSWLNHETNRHATPIGEVHVRRIDNPGHEDLIAVNGGFMEMSDNVASIVADSAERERDIDLSRAEAARQRAQQHLQEAQAQHDTDEAQRAQVALQRAINRIHVKTGK